MVRKRSTLDAIITVLKITFVGHIVVGSAKSSNQITAGMAIIGFGGALCQVCVRMYKRL